MHSLLITALIGAAFAQEPPAEAAAEGAAEAPAEPACPVVDLDTQVDLAISELTDGEFDSATRLATGGVEALPCLVRVADPDDLASLWLVLGTAHFYQGSPQLAEAPYRQAGAVYPGWFNDRLGSQPRELWVSATADLAGAATVTAWPIPDDGVLYVDGVGREGREAEVLPGDHLVQVAVGAEVHYAQLLTLEDGQLVDLVTGLPEPTKSRAFTLPLGLGIGAFVAAGGAVTGAILLDQELAGLSRDGSPGRLRAARFGSVGLAYVATPLLIAGSGYGVWSHIKRRR